MNPIPPGALLAPIDLSTASLQAVTHAADLAARMDTPLVLLHVVSPRDVEEGLAEGRFVDQQLEDIRSSLVGWFTMYVPDAIRSKARVIPMAVVGHPEHEIPAVARAIRAQMIIMATHGRTGLSRLVLGSVAAGVLRHAPCPVLAVPLALARREAEAGRSDAKEALVVGGR